MDGALHLEKKVQNRLNEMDLNLFLDKEYVGGTLYYSVKYAASLGEEPNPILLWATPGGRPLPLSMEIVDRVRANDGDIRSAIAQATANNAALKEKARQARNEEMEGRAKEFEKSAKKLYTSGPWSPKADVTAWSNKKK